MSNSTEQLRERAISAKRELKYGQISLEEAKEITQPYIDRINETSKKLAKIYGVKPKLANVTSFLR